MLVVVKHNEPEATQSVFIHCILEGTLYLQTK